MLGRVVDAVERAPNDILLTGGGLFHDRGTAPNGPLLAGGYVWRSVGGGPFTQIFPSFGAAERRQPPPDVNAGWPAGMSR